MKRKPEIRNREPEEPCKETRKECGRFLLLLWPNGGSECCQGRGVPCAPGSRACTWAPRQEGFVGSCDVLAYFWNRLSHHHFSLNSPLTLWFISTCPRWVPNAFTPSMLFPTLAKPGLWEGVKRTVLNDNVLRETFASCKFSLFSKKK